MAKHLTILTAILILLSPPLLAGKRMNKCVDPEGNITFTTQGCAEDETKKKIYVENAQSPVTSLRPAERQMLGSISTPRRAASAGSSQSSKPKKTSRKSNKRRRLIRRCNKK
jgi:hypothetical protein